MSNTDINKCPDCGECLDALGYCSNLECGYEIDDDDDATVCTECGTRCIWDGTATIGNHYFGEWWRCPVCNETELWYEDET